MKEPISSLDPVFTAGHQVAEAVRHHRGVSRREAKLIALELFAQVRLPDPRAVVSRYPQELSGGIAQRVAIARALAGEPRILIADEPTTALDVTVQAEILDLLRDLREQTGMALIMVTHDWGVLADSCERTVRGRRAPGRHQVRRFRDSRHPRPAHRTADLTESCPNHLASAARAQKEPQ